MLRLLGAAIEGVGDASLTLIRRKYLRMSSTARRICSTTGSPNSRASSSCPKSDALALAIGAIDEIIETDLAHRDDSAKFEAMSQQLQIPRLGTINVKRMDTVRGSAAGIALYDRRSAVEAGCFHRRHEDPPDSRRAGALHDGVAVRVEFHCIQMTVGVD